jgi:hypothetical protein
LNPVIKKYDLNMFYIAGPGHGGPAIVSNVYLEGTWSEVYPDIMQDEAGLQKLFKQFSFPGGISSHVVPTTPGSIHEGGELGYSLSHAFGAVFDNPDLIVGLIVTGGAILTPLLMVILMIAGDFLAMSLTTDNVRPSPRPNAWPVGTLTIAGIILGVCLLTFCSATLLIGKFPLHFAGPGVADFGLHRARARVRKSGGVVRDPRPPASMGFASQPLANWLLGRGYSNCLDNGHRRICHDSPAHRGGARYTGRRGAFALLVNVAKLPVFSRLRIA